VAYSHSNWKTIAAGIIFLALAMCRVHRAHFDGRKTRGFALSSATTAIDSTMPESATVTGEANAKLNRNGMLLISVLNALLVQHPAKCLYIASSTHKASGGAQYAGRDGVDSSALRRYAANLRVLPLRTTCLYRFCGQRRQ